MRARVSKYSVEFEGIRELMHRIDPVHGEVMTRVQGAVVNAMVECTEDLLGRSMRDAPVDEGTLRASGSAAVYQNGKRLSQIRSRERETPMRELPEASGERTLIEGGSGDSIEGVVGFNTPYALKQHENTAYSHPKGGKDHYLSDNLNAQSGRYLGHLQDGIAGALR